jgi:hypothetical protein
VFPVSDGYRLAAAPQKINDHQWIFVQKSVSGHWAEVRVATETSPGKLGPAIEIFHDRRGLRTSDEEFVDVDFVKKPPAFSPDGRYWVVAIWKEEGDGDGVVHVPGVACLEYAEDFERISANVLYFFPDGILLEDGKRLALEKTAHWKTDGYTWWFQDSEDESIHSLALRGNDSGKLRSRAATDETRTATTAELSSDADGKAIRPSYQARLQAALLARSG